MNNPMQLALQALRSGGDPVRFIQQQASVNPMAAQAFKMINGKDSRQLQQMAQNMAKERGTTVEAVARQLGLF